MSERVVIIGASHAGVTVIETLRRKAFRGRLVLISEEKLPLYSPTTLPYLIDGKDRETLVLRPRAFFRGIEVIEARAAAVDERRESITLTSGKKVRYGKLVVATGASPVVPFPVAAGAPVFTVRTLNDIARIEGRLKGDASVLVVGAGLIGIHLAQVFLGRGQKLSLVELGDQVLPGLVNRELAQKIEQRFAEGGAMVSLATSIARLEEREAVLADGSTMGFDFAVVAAGVRPNTEALGGTSIDMNGGIRVNQWMETTIPGIFAAGDVTEYRDFFSGVPRLNPTILNAVEQGRTVASRLVGIEDAHPGVISCMACTCLGMNLFSVGRITPTSNDQLFEETDNATNAYCRLVVHDGRLEGAVFCDTPVDHGLFYNLIKKRVVIDGLEKKILKEPVQWAKVLGR